MAEISQALTYRSHDGSGLIGNQAWQRLFHPSRREYLLSLLTKREKILITFLKRIRHNIYHANSLGPHILKLSI